jgi:hypothetical protein
MTVAQKLNKTTIEEIAARAMHKYVAAKKLLDLLQQKEEKKEALQKINQALAKASEEIFIQTPVREQLLPFPEVKYLTPCKLCSVLVLPKLIEDHSDVDYGNRDHLDAQAEQIIDIFKKLTDKEHPFIESGEIKNYILCNFEIPHPEYWRTKTSPKEPERWWKNIYDKAIERLDLVLHRIARGKTTGKKGLYALTEYVEKQVS